MSLTWAALAAVGVGTGVSAYSTLKAGKEAAKAGERAAAVGALQKKQYEQEAKVARLQAEEGAKATLYAGQYESREKRREKRRAKASRIAQAFAQGGTLIGSKLISIADEAAEYEADASMLMHNAQFKAANLRYAGLLRSIQLRNMGKMAFYRGRVAKYQGEVARRASRMRAFADIFTTIGETALMYKRPPKTTPKIGQGGYWAGMSGQGTGLGGYTTPYGTMYA